MGDNSLVSERKGHDIREDEEQGVKLVEIVDLLVAAGYFRARIKGLSAFDKVVGGMAWCMESCHYDVDVNLLFQENSTIGQKIALTEKIVTVLPRMGCPHRIEPHQIQGLDLIHVFPVIQWLVKQSVAVREEHRDSLRESAVREFERKFRPSDATANLISCLHTLQEKYRPRRVLRRRDSLPEDEAAQVESVLMEYGLMDYMPCSTGSAPDPAQSFIKALEQEEVVAARAYSDIVSAQGQAIAAVSEQFANHRVDDSAEDTLRRQREALLEEKQALEAEIEAEAERLSGTRKVLQTLHADHAETNNNVRVYSQLQDLVIMDESLKKQEQDFREHCRSELERLQYLLRDASERSQGDAEDADTLCEAERARVASLRLQMARRNRSVAQLQRKLDEVPGRAELAQYQRRFLELYSLVAQKHAETKQFYTMYNTLEDTRLYLAKELNLLNSVLDTYSQAMSNALDKSLFIQQFEGIVTAVEANKRRVEARRDADRAKRDALSQQLLDLVEQQRHYVAVVRQLKIEVKRNEMLLAELRAS